MVSISLFQSRGFLLRWISISTIGMLLVAGASTVAGYTSLILVQSPTTLESTIEPVIVGLGGAMLGVLQWSLLRRGIIISGWWIPASILGLLAAIAIRSIVGGRVTSGIISLLTPFAVAGVSLGLAQWAVLRRSLPYAGWWIVASVVGLSLGVYLGIGILALLSSSAPTPPASGLTIFLRRAFLLIAFVLPGVIYGGSTWYALAELVHPRASKTVQKNGFTP